MTRLDYEPTIPAQPNRLGFSLIAMTLLAALLFICSVLYALMFDRRYAMEIDGEMVVVVFALAAWLSIVSFIGSLVAPRYQRYWGATLFLSLLAIVSLILRPSLNE
jgi:hypothetical protein